MKNICLCLSVCIVMNNNNQSFSMCWKCISDVIVKKCKIGDESAICTFGCNEIKKQNINKSVNKTTNVFMYMTRMNKKKFIYQL